MSWEDHAQEEVSTLYSVFGWLPPATIERIWEKWRQIGEQQPSVVSNPVVLAVELQEQAEENYDEPVLSYSPPSQHFAAAPNAPEPVYSRQPDPVPVYEAAAAQQIPFIDNLPPPAQTAQMPAGRAPTVPQFDFPRAVYAGQPFRINIYADDADRDLAYLSVRQQGRGVLQNFDLTDGGGYSGAGRYVDTIAPEAGPIYLRVEVNDKAGNGFEGAWQKIDIVVDEAPSSQVINQWLTVESIPVSPGVHRNVVNVLPGAPAIFAEAAEEANFRSSQVGGYSPQALYDLVSDLIVRETAEQQAAGVEVGELGTPAITGTQTQTIVAYQGTYPVLQQVQPDGQVVQWLQTPGGPSGQVIVENFGQYVAPVVEQIPHNVGQALNETANSGLPPSAVDVQEVATNVPPVAAFDPVHRLAGWDASGNDVYRLTNEAGNLVEWSVLAGHDSREMIPGSFHYLMGNEATHVVSNTPPTSDGIFPPAATSESGQNKTLLIVGFGLAAWWLGSRA